jgi:BlaI family penicillinase repressor
LKIIVDKYDPSVYICKWSIYLMLVRRQDMPPTKSEPLSPSEWKIMQIVWELKSCAARDVYQAAGKIYGWAPSTAKTILRRLVEKGYLKTTQIGNSFLYQPTQPALKSLLHAADDLLGRALNGTIAPLLAYMVKKSDLSKEDIAELRSLLEKYEKDEES